MGIRFGRYETLEPLAAGGMAKVYRGRAVADGGFERIVALKVMHANLQSDPEFVDMFLDEARLAAKIIHPNVVATHDVMRSPGGTFLVMDYVDGYDFAMVQRALRARDQRVPIGVTLRILVDALNGLAAAHELTGPDGAPLRLVHRDVSPQNILIDRNTGNVKLTDFGVAHAAERLSNTAAGALKGKLGYLSPEHARGDGLVDGRSDVYSAAVVLWEALTARPMFSGRPRMRVLGDILQGNIPAPHTVEPSVPMAISEACMEALALEPGERTPSARAFATRLRGAAASAGIQLADEEGVRAFIAECGVEAYSRSCNRRLQDDEETVVEERPVGLQPSVPPPGRRRLRPVWVMAAAMAAGVVGALVWLRVPGTDSLPAPREQVPQPLAERVSERAALEVEVDVEPLARSEVEPPPVPKSEPSPKAPARRPPPADKMYHPSTL